MKTGNSVIVMIEEVLDKIEGCETLLDKLWDLMSPRCVIQNLDDPSTLGYKYWSRGFPLLDRSGQEH